jgi:hypothetical protein
MTTSSTTRGELAKPQSGTFFVPPAMDGVPSVSDAASCDHTSAPSPASSAFRIPVAPNV